ncbi:MAG: ectoine hydroxylase [Acidimicrobiia bacterium]|nr:ectoine hydroxylase [Acidimicrobiia bacterium]
MTTTDVRADLYPSRVADRPTITERLDPVVHGDSSGPLDPEVLAGYEDDGFVVLPGFLGGERLAALNDEVDRLAADEALAEKPQAIVEPDSRALRSIFEVHRLEGVFRDLVHDPYLVGVARQLLGSDVYVHQSRVNLKPGFRGREFYWHSDFETWHTEDGMPRMRAVSCSVTLTDNHPWNGPLLLVAGSHGWYVTCVGATPDRNFEQSLRRQEIGVPDDESLSELVRRGSIRHAVGPAGTVVFFECNAMHGSNGNITPQPRRNVFFVYNSVENALEAPFAAPGPRPEYIASRDFTPVPV